MNEKEGEDQGDKAKGNPPRRAFILTENTIVYEAEPGERGQERNDHPTVVQIQSHLPIDLKRDWRDTIFKWLNVFLAAVTFVIVAYYTRAAFIQAQQSIRAAKAAEEGAAAATSAASTAASALGFSREEFRQEQRPYIWLSAGMALPDTPVGSVPLEELKKRNLSLVISLQAFNGGKSPAIKIINTQVVVIVDTTEVADKRLRSYIPEYLNGESILPPNSSVVLKSPQEHIVITDQLLNDLGSKVRRIYVIGRIKYFDIFSPTLKVPYETAFCAQVNPSGLPFSNCLVPETAWIK
jgi:hypothetical protein